MPDLSENDFLSILSLCLLDDVYLLEGKLFSQTSGIAMGNSAAPPLAIIFMDYIENKILDTISGIIFWKRYIDDVFSISTVEPQDILDSANSIHPCISFTLELPINNMLPFLDCNVSRGSNSFMHELYIKPTHSGTCLPFSSHVPQSRKKNLVKAEFDRATRNSSSCKVTQSVTKIDSKLLANGYPPSFIEKFKKAPPS